MDSNKQIFWKKQMLSLIYLVSIFSSTAYGAVSYVNNSGSPSCGNSAGYGTLSKPYCTITYALSNISGGDTIYVRAGTYNEVLYITGPAGSAGSPTTIAVYPGDTVTLRGNGVSSGRSKIENTSYITFDGFKLTNSNQGFFVDNSNHITVQNIEIYTVGQEGFHVHYNSSYVTLQNSIIHDTRAWQYNGEGVYVGTADPSSPNDNTNNILIKNNIIYNTNDECIELKAGTHDCTLDGNICYNNLKDSGITALNWGAIEVDPANDGTNPQIWGSNPNHIVKNNTIYGTGSKVNTGIGVHTGSTIYNNVIYGMTGSYSGIYIDNQQGESYSRNVYHNTIDLPSTRAITISAGTTDVRNNIGPTTTNNMATNSAYYVNVGTHDYHLVAGTAPINAGVNLTATVPIDKDGTSRTANGLPDRGAYEYTGIISSAKPSPPLNLMIN